MPIVGVTWQSIMTKLFTVQKIYSKIYSTSSADIYHDVKTYKNGEVV